MVKIELLKTRITSTIIKLLRELDKTEDQEKRNYIFASLCTLDTVMDEIKDIEGVVG